ncbi:MAG: isopentenyl phosphate kinase [Candidatus Diapherotrites archaeon]
MSANLYITKLGGSVITDKASGEARVREDAVRRIAQEIKRASAEKKFKLIIVLGAGPFGHVPVEKYGINNGVRTKEQVKGFVETHNSMERLCAKVVEIFNEEGLLAFPSQASACITQKNKKITRFDTGLVGGLIKMDGFVVPIMYGDMVLDSKLGASVVSGDAIAAYLAKKLHAKKVFFGTDVEGVYAAEPKAGFGGENKNAGRIAAGGAKIIKKITNSNFRAVLRGVGGSKATDVTSGMRGKLENLEMHMKGTSAVVFNLNGTNNLYLLLGGKNCIGTEIALE